MKIDLRVVDLRDDSEETFSLESWETIRQAKQRMKARRGIPDVEQHYYLGDELLSDGMPIEQLRSHAIRTGKLPEPAEGQTLQVTTVKMYIGKQPVNFADMLLADVIAKLKNAGEERKLIRIRVHKLSEVTVSIRVDASTITVDGVKAELVRVLGPPSFTGLNVQNILLYPREKQPGRPLQGEEIREFLGPRPQVDLEAYPTRPPVNLTCVVLRWGILLKERFDIVVEDHLLLGDLKEILLEKLSNSSDRKISQRYTRDTIVFKLNKTRVDAETSNTLRRKYGVEADELWLRIFSIKDGSKVRISV